MLPGIIAIDIVGGARGGNPDAPRLREELAESLAQAAPPHSSVESTDFGVRLVLSDARDSFDVLQLLVSRWIAVRDTTASPLILGLKIGLHAGRNLTNSTERFMGFSSIGQAFRLAWAGPSDSIRLSEAMLFLLEPRLKAANVPILPKRFLIAESLHMEGAEIPLAAFLGPGQFRVSVSPPDELMHYLAQNPAFARLLEPRAFEGVVARLFESEGYDVELQAQSRDGGVDLIAVRSTQGPVLGGRYLVQCKRYAESRTVGVEVVRELAGVGAVEPHTGLVLVTTSSFTTPARDFARQPTLMWRLHLKDYTDLGAWLDRYSLQHRSIDV